MLIKLKFNGVYCVQKKRRIIMVLFIIFRGRKECSTSLVRKSFVCSHTLVLFHSAGFINDSFLRSYKSHGYISLFEFLTSSSFRKHVLIMRIDGLSLSRTSVPSFIRKNLCECSWAFLKLIVIPKSDRVCPTN